MTAEAGTATTAGAIAVRAAVLPLGPGRANTLCVEVRVGGARPLVEASFLAVLPEDFEADAQTGGGPLYEADPWDCAVNAWCERSGSVTLTCTVPARSWRRFSE